jgi:alpha-tubulin suppressor-like RCC1 family protein
MAAGSKHTCALTNAGAIKCWGLNDKGQLGDGTTSDSDAPVDVSGLGAAASTIATGEKHTCAVLTTGAVKCWGQNGDRQLGDGTNNDSSTPVGVSGLTSGFGLVAAGQSHSCAVTLSGDVRCWGRNDKGQLGNGSTTDSGTPVSVTGLSGVRAIAAGEKHNCVTLAAGSVKCWGHNNKGQLGNGTTSDSSVPVPVTGVSSGGVGVAAGTEHSCTVLNTGKALCWGENSRGQLGDGTTSDSSVPVVVIGIP